MARKKRNGKKHQPYVNFFQNCFLFKLAFISLLPGFGGRTVFVDEATATSLKKKEKKRAPLGF